MVVKARRGETGNSEYLFSNKFLGEAQTKPYSSYKQVSNEKRALGFFGYIVNPIFTSYILGIDWVPILLLKGSNRGFKQLGYHPGCFGYFLGDEILPSYVGIRETSMGISDPIITQPGFNGKQGRFFVFFLLSIPLSI